MNTGSPYGLDVIEGGTHSLLEPPSPAYSNVSVRRAFIVWMYCGQRNKFKDVCNYYHYLEAMEEKLPAEKRATSRYREFDLFTNPPPTSPYLLENFPTLYPDTPIEPHYIKKLEAIKNEKCIFKLEGFSDIRQKGVTTTEIVEASQIIRKYCKTHLIPLRKFLEEYKAYANKCGLKDSVSNVAGYIKRKMVQAELETVANYPKTFSFLNSNTDLNNDELKSTDLTQSISKPLENDIKLLSGVRSKSPTSRGIAKYITNHDKRYNTCAEFFKSFNQQNKSSSYSTLMPSLEDLNNVFGEDKFRSRSVESLIQGRNGDSLGPKVNNVIFDSYIAKMNDLAKLRKI